jgi:hypothetical protein
MSKQWTAKDARVEDARASDDRVTTALWEENNLGAHGRVETITDRAEFAELLRKAGWQ